MKGELKYFDIGPNTTYNVGTATNVTVLNAMVQNTDATGRIGKQIYNKSVRIHGMLYPQAISTIYQLMRVMLVWDAQPNGVLATSADILGLGPTSASDLNLDNRERFTVIRDQKWSIAPRSAGASQGVAVDMFVSLGNKKTTFNGPSAGIGNVATGALLMLLIASSNTIGEEVQALLTTRVRYYDN